MVFESLVELHAWLHSCLCFSLFEKLFLKASSTPSYLSSFQAFSYRNLDTSSTLGGSIEKVLVPSIASRHLMDWSSLNSYVWCFVPRHFLDTCICRRLNPRHLAWHLDQHLSTPSSVEIHWTSIYRFCAIRSSFLSISLSIPLSPHLPKHLLSLQTSTKVIFKLFQGFFYTW